MATRSSWDPPIHMLLDSENQGVRLTGRMRTESSNYPPEHGKDIVCYEVEVLFPDEGLLRQCYYCLCWEACGPIRRFSQCGDDTFWCEEVSIFPLSTYSFGPCDFDVTNAVK